MIGPRPVGYTELFHLYESSGDDGGARYLDVAPKAAPELARRDRARPAPHGPPALPRLAPGARVAGVSGAPTFSLACADAVAWLSTLRAGSVDLIVTDPPYESLEKHRAIGTTTRLKHSKSSSNDWFPIFPNARFDELFRELYRVLARNGHFYLFCDAETMFVAKPRAEAAGFRFWKPLVWDKKRIGMGYHYRARYELVLFFEKGKRRLTDLGAADIIEAPRVINGYPTEKPRAVTDLLVRQSSLEGEVVIDPFMGSGTTGLSAIAGRRSFLGCDVNPEALALTTRRLVEAGGVEGAPRAAHAPRPSLPAPRPRSAMLPGLDSPPGDGTS